MSRRSAIEGKIQPSDHPLTHSQQALDFAFTSPEATEDQAKQAAAMILESLRALRSNSATIAAYDWHIEGHFLDVNVPEQRAFLSAEFPDLSKATITIGETIGIPPTPPLTSAKSQKLCLGISTSFGEDTTKIWRADYMIPREDTILWCRADALHGKKISAMRGVSPNLEDLFDDKFADFLSLLFKSETPEYRRVGTAEAQSLSCYLLDVTVQK